MWRTHRRQGADLSTLWHRIKSTGPSVSGPDLFPEPQPTATTDFDTSNLTWPTLSLFIKNFWLITKLTLVIVIPFEIFKTLSLRDYVHDEQLALGVLVLDYMCKVLIAPALIYALMRVRETGKAPGINKSYRWSVENSASSVFAQLSHGYFRPWDWPFALFRESCFVIAANSLSISSPRKRLGA